MTVDQRLQSNSNHDYWRFFFCSEAQKYAWRPSFTMTFDRSSRSYKRCLEPSWISPLRRPPVNAHLRVNILMSSKTSKGESLNFDWLNTATSQHKSYSFLPSISNRHVEFNLQTEDLSHRYRYRYRYGLSPPTQYSQFESTFVRIICDNCRL